MKIKNIAFTLIADDRFYPDIQARINELMDGIREQFYPIVPKFGEVRRIEFPQESWQTAPSYQIRVNVTISCPLTWNEIYAKVNAVYPTNVQSFKSTVIKIAV